MALRVWLVSDRHPALQIHANPEVMYPHVERLNCVALDSATGRRYVFDGGPTRVNASIAWKCVDYETVKKYEDFLLRHAIPGHWFMIICPSYIDFGKGKGTDINEAYYAGPPASKDLITPGDNAGLYYNIELPYMFVRED